MLGENILKFIIPIIQICEKQFPRKCSNCGKEFINFREFVLNTKPIGKLQLPYNEQKDIMAIMTYTNCKCGSTLTLSCINPDMHTHFERILKEESIRAKRKIEYILLELRHEIRKKVISDNKI